MTDETKRPEPEQPAQNETPGQVDAAALRQKAEALPAADRARALELITQLENSKPRARGRTALKRELIDLLDVAPPTDWAGPEATKQAERQRKKPDQ